jgi:hypothetical protein
MRRPKGMVSVSDPHSPRPAIRPSVNFHVSLNFFPARTLNPNAVDAERFAMMRKDSFAWNTEDINHLVTALAIPYDAGQHRRHGASAAVRTASQVSHLVPLEELFRLFGTGERSSLRCRNPATFQRPRLVLC